MTISQCSVNDCEKQLKNLGMCLHHYQQDLKRRNPLRTTYNNMKNRCYAPYSSSYHNYGARGIKVCKRWLGKNGYKNFCNDMGDKPSPKHQLERIDNDGDYKPSNCRWATKNAQMRNMRKNHYVIYNGKKMIMKDAMKRASKDLGITVSSISRRIYVLKWDIETALTSPAGFYNRWYAPERTVKEKRRWK